MSPYAPDSNSCKLTSVVPVVTDPAECLKDSADTRSSSRSEQLDFAAAPLILRAANRAEGLSNMTHMDRTAGKPTKEIAAL